MHEISSLDCSHIAQDLQIRKVQVESVVQLLDEGNTVPFITRYRKERTGGLNEEVIRQIQTRVQFLRQLAQRKQTILKSIEQQGKLNDDLRDAIVGAETTKRLEDLYLPFKPKKRSLASTARERGLEPVALAVWYNDPVAGNLEEILPSLVNPEKDLKSADDVRTGVQHILAEMIAETAMVRASVRSVLWETGRIVASKNEKLQEGQGLEYKNYFQFTESARQIPAHRILAINRGEKEGALKIRLEWLTDAVQGTALQLLAEHLAAVEGKMPAPADKPTPHAEAGGSSELQSDTPVIAHAETPQTSPESNATSDAGTPATPMEPPIETSPEAVGTVFGAEMAPHQTEIAAPAEASPPSGQTPEGFSPPPEAQAAPLVAQMSAPLSAASAPAEQLAPDFPYRTPHASLLKTVLADALQRLLLPSLEREIRNELTDEAESHAVNIFARNLRSLLLQPPLWQRRVLGIDPGFRTGCKLAALDEYGNLLDQTVIFPHASHPKKGRGKGKGPDSPAPSATAPAASTAPTANPEQPATPAEPTAPQDITPPAPAPDGDAPVAMQGGHDSVSEIKTESTTSDTPAPAMVEIPSEPVKSQQGESATSNETSAQPGFEASAQQTSGAPDVPASETPSQPAAEVARGAAQETKAAEPAHDKRAEAKAKLVDIIKKHNIQVVALGNGTGCRETEELVADVIATDCPELAYVIVNEAGASVYSVSPVGREEFPEFDATLRSTISIGRRLQDPLSELVKVDPQNIGVGLYQHDMSRKELKESLDGVVESCVNQVGVDVNTASVALLRYVSGLNQLVARELVDYRAQHGPFTSREALLQVSGLGPQRYVQAAGFLKIPNSPNPLDHTWIHPESYPIAQRIIEELGYQPAVLNDRGAHEQLQSKLRTLAPAEVARQLEVGTPTVEDIFEALVRPGRDPREDLPPPIFKKGILQLEDLQPGMELKGTVLNVVDFGAFVDVGLKDSGLVHLSQLANRYIKSPYDVVAVNDVVTVWVLTVDKDRHHVSLTMIKPGTERKPTERRPQQPREGGRPPRGRRGPPRGTGGPGEGQQNQPPQQQRRSGPPPRRSGPPQGAPGQQGAHTGQPQGAGSGNANQQGGGNQQGGQTRQGQPPRPAPPPPPPRKPRREPPKPKLSQAALEGKVPLRTFGELSALFAAKKEDVPPPSQAPASPPPEAQPTEQAAAPNEGSPPPS